MFLGKHGMFTRRQLYQLRYIRVNNTFEIVADTKTIVHLFIGYDLDGTERSIAMGLPFHCVIF